MLRNCAFLTLEDRTGYYIYDYLLIDPLAKLGWSVEEIPWNRKKIDWAQYDAVVIRSTWDYQKSPQNFIETLENIENKTILFNPVDICRWNLNKKYLRDLQNKGVQIVPTFWLEGLSKNSIESIFHTTSVKRLVAKPLIGANADDSFVLTYKDSDSWKESISVFTNREVMLQPFVDSIQTEGEYSLFYFGGQFSHAIVKRPALDEYRVQEEHGGIIQSIDPDEDILNAGYQAIKAINKTLLYARVDLVRLDSEEPALIELELIEPSLYFEQCPGSAERFAAQFDVFANKS